MYFTPQSFVTIYAPILPKINYPSIIAAALKKSFQQYSCMFINQKRETFQKGERLTQSAQTKLFKKNSPTLIAENTLKVQKRVETEFKKEFENLVSETKNSDYRQKGKRQSFLKAKTNIIEVLEALSQEQLESESEQIEENEGQINYKNKSSSTIQDLKRTTRKYKKIQKPKLSSFQTKKMKPSYSVTVPVISILETIQLPRFLIDKQQIRKKKQSLLERMVISQKNIQRVKIYVSRQRREMRKLL